MGASTPHNDIDQQSPSAQSHITSTRRILNIHIVLHKLMTIGALTLLPLLAWHNAMTQVVEKHDMPRMWEEDFRDMQMSRPKIWVWVFMWILVPVDLLQAILALGWYHEVLHSRTNDEIDEGGVDDTSDRDAKDEIDAHHEDTPSAALNTFFTSLAATYQCITSRAHRYKASSTPSHPRTPQTYYRPFRPRLPPTARLLLLILYDCLLALILALHIYTYIITIDPSHALCESSYLRNQAGNMLMSPADDAMAEQDADFPYLNLEARCARLNWFIHIAGGFASALAATLAVVHISVVVLRLYELVLRFINGQKEKKGSVELDWQHAPRDVDIHTRTAPTVRATTSRLSRISEEEYSIGGGVVRRRHTIQSKGSTRWVGREEGKGRLEGVLLECLVP